MATVKISNLSAVTSLNSADVFPTSDTGANPGSPTTYKVTVKNLANSLPQVSSSISSSFATSASWASTVTGSTFTSANPALSASFARSASFATTASYALNAAGVFPYTGSAIISGTLVITGSINVNGSITGSLFGTSSYVTGSIHTAGNLALSASYTVTSSYALTSVSSSYALTASYINDLNQNLTITGSVIISGSPNPEIRVIGDMVVTGSLIVSGNNGAGIFSQGATLVDYVSTITSTGSYMVWRAPFSCSVVALYGYYLGGTSPQVNALRSGSSGIGRITGSNLTLSSENVWNSAIVTGLQNKDFNAGDSLMIILSGSSNYQLAAQVDFIKKF